MYFINFIVQMPAVKHPGQRTVLELTNYETSHQDSEFIRVHIFGNASKGKKVITSLLIVKTHLESGAIAFPISLTQTRQ